MPCLLEDQRRPYDNKHQKTSSRPHQDCDVIIQTAVPLPLGRGIDSEKPMDPMMEVDGIPPLDKNPKYNKLTLLPPCAVGDFPANSNSTVGDPQSPGFPGVPLSTIVPQPLREPLVIGSCTGQAVSAASGSAVMPPRGSLLEQRNGKQGLVQQHRHQLLVRTLQVCK